MRRPWRELVLPGVLLALAVLAAAPPARAEFTVDARGAILVEADSGQVLWEQNADLKWYPASMTKIMTMALALEAVHEGKVSLSDKVRASERAASFGGTQVYLEPGEEFTLEQMLAAIAVGSANDASVAVAEFLAGSEEEFVAMMNAKARELGLRGTHYANSHGLDDPEHYTTPRDMATVARYSLRFPEMLRLTSLKEYDFRDMHLYSTNKALWWYPGADGLKTGTTSRAARNLTLTAQKDGLRLIGVVMGVDRPNGHFSEAMKLLNYGFARFEFRQLAREGETLALLPVDKGERDLVPLVAKTRVGLVLPRGSKDEITTRLEVPRSLPAPLASGQKAGEIVLLRQGQEVGRRDLVVAADVGRAGLWRQVAKTWQMVVGSWRPQQSS